MARKVIHAIRNNGWVLVLAGFALLIAVGIATR